MGQGLFIVFEGIDGSGKTTQARMLSERLMERGRETVVTREPGGTRVGTKIRQLLLDTANREITFRAEALLYAADRAQHVEEKIIPAVRAGKIVICDRFTDSTIAYQGGGRGMDTVFLDRLNHLATAGLQPHLVIILDVHPEVGLVRIKNERAVTDRLESESLQFHRRVRETYLMLARRSGSYTVINGEMQPEEVHRQIWKRVEGLPGV